jgi:hypothetical protein
MRSDGAGSAALTEDQAWTESQGLQQVWEPGMTGDDGEELHLLRTLSTSLVWSAARSTVWTSNASASGADSSPS